MRIMPQKPLIPEPTAAQIAYSRVAAAKLAVDLLNTAADALMHGTPMSKPRLPRVSPTDDAVTARSLQIIATTLANCINTNTEK